MCGINGIVSNSCISRKAERLSKMNESLKHRGPDASSSQLVDDRVALGHTRLSIIDLDDRSNQPMSSNSGNVTMVFNGEIVNFPELRKKLETEYDFKTTSDSEVILAAYEIFGLDWFLSRAIGMFGLALYDHRTSKLYLIRDRSGIKPLYYYQEDNLIIFSSEVKGILNSGLVKAEFNELAIDEYLANRYVREPYTFFKSIYQVKASHYLEIDKDLNARQCQYWELPELNFSKDYNEQQVIKETGHEVIEAVKRWSVSDVQLGTFLSGGVDSSLISAIIAKTKDNLKTFTIGFPEEGFNEFSYARLVAEQYNTSHEEILMDQTDYMSHWEKLIKFKDAPLAVPNEIPLAVMSTVLKKDITVVLSGEGADELFGGYGRIYRSSFDFDNLQKNGKAAQGYYDFFLSKYEYVNRTVRDKFLVASEGFRSHFDTVIGEDFKNHRNEENVFRYFQKYHIAGLLSRVDMTSMQTSIEARPPFLDHRLIEHVYQNVPYDLKLRWNSDKARKEAQGMDASQYSERLDIPKYVLKEISREFLPEEVIYRRKMGFPVPLNNWIDDLLKSSSDELSSASWLKPESVKNLTSGLEGNHRFGQLTWMFINVEKFRKLYFEKEWRWN